MNQTPKKDLSPDVTALRVFLPASDFKASLAFYTELGFTASQLSDKLALMQLGAFSFLLQEYNVPGFAANFMMQLVVEDVDAWWARIAGLGLEARYKLRPPRAPEMQPWGLKVAYLVDPTGVLWHIAEKPQRK